eukprot:g10772.t1
MCTAQNLLQRFFYRKPLTDFDAFSVAMGCMLLAMKIEEDPRQPRAVVLVFHRMFERRIGVEPSSMIPPESLRILRDEMLRVELHVLKELGFGFYNIMDHPHKFILYYLKVLELDIEGDVSQRAWNYVNDSLRTDLSLRFRSEAPTEEARVEVGVLGADLRTATGVTAQAAAHRGWNVRIGVTVAMRGTTVHRKECRIERGTENGRGNPGVTEATVERGRETITGGL